MWMFSPMIIIAHLSETVSWSPDALEILPEFGLPCPADLGQPPNDYYRG